MLRMVYQGSARTYTKISGKRTSGLIFARRLVPVLHERVARSGVLDDPRNCPELTFASACCLRRTHSAKLDEAIFEIAINSIALDLIAPRRRSGSRVESERGHAAEVNHGIRSTQYLEPASRSDGGTWSALRDCVLD